MGGDRRLKSRNPKIRLDREKKGFVGGETPPAAAEEDAGARGNHARWRFFWKVGGGVCELEKVREVYLSLLPE